MKFEDVKKWNENFVRFFYLNKIYLNNSFILKGFLETEIKKDGLPLKDPEDNVDAPKPREMIDLEVIYITNFIL
jgi:hypothetical protein